MSGLVVADSEFVSLPKIDVHAHLSGSLSHRTLTQLQHVFRTQFPGRSLPKIPDWFRSDQQTAEFLDAQGNFDIVFHLFKIVQDLTQTLEAVKIAVENTLQEFNDENVVYLELRSTPRSVPGFMSKEDYLRTVLKTIQAGNQNLDLWTGFLVSIDRRLSQAEAQETLELALRLREEFPDLLLGLDLSGDARVGQAEDFLPLLVRGRDRGLKLAVHLAEVPNATEVEKVVKELGPDRIGHGTCFHPSTGGSDYLYDLLLASRIPVEICLRSNLIARSVPVYEKHHLVPLWKSGHPVIICTDDKGVFSCTSSIEYQRAAKLVGMENDAKAFSKHLFPETLKYIFASDEIRDKISAKMVTFQK